MGEQRQTTIWRSGCRGAMAHRAVSAVSRPSCEGTLPVRSLPLRRLREGRQSGRSWGNGDGRRGRQVRRVRFPTRRHPPPPPSHPLSCHAWRRGCRGGVVAHSSVSAVSSPSCVGTLPLRSMTIKYLREVLRSGIVGNGNGRRGRQVRRACFPYARPPSMPSKPLPCHGLEARGCRGAVAYRRSSTVSSPSCEGRLPVMSL